MKKDARFIFERDLPTGNGGVIKRGTNLYRTHECYYLDGGLQTPEYAECFDGLIEDEEKNGWYYLCPIVEKTLSGMVDL